MYHIAYEKETNKILGFIKTDSLFEPKEVFVDFKDYEVLQTEEEPPFFEFDNYKIEKENEKIKYSKIEKILSKLEESEQLLAKYKEELKATSYILLDFLEGELTASDYSATKKKRQTLRQEIKALEKQILGLKGV